MAIFSKRFYLFGSPDYWRRQQADGLYGHSINEAVLLSIGEGTPPVGKPLLDPRLYVKVIEDRLVITGLNDGTQVVLYDGPWPPTSESIAEYLSTFAKRALTE